MPACVQVIRWTAPEVPHVPLHVRTVPAVGLPWELEVTSGRAALSLVPSSLVDGESVAPVLVGQALHAAPDPDRARWRELVQMIKAVRVGGRVTRVGLHFAVRAFVLVLAGPCIEIIVHFFAVLEHVFEANIFTGHTAFATRPISWELIVCRWVRYLGERAACQQGQGCRKVSHLVSVNKLKLLIVLSVLE